MIKRTYFYRAKIRDCDDVTVVSGTTDYTRWLPNPVSFYSGVVKAIADRLGVTTDQVEITAFTRI